MSPGFGVVLTGGQRLFDDASLRLAKGRRILDPRSGSHSCLVRWVFGTRLGSIDSPNWQYIIVYSTYIPRVYILYIYIYASIALVFFVLYVSMLRPSFAETRHLHFAKTEWNENSEFLWNQPLETLQADVTSSCVLGNLIRNRQKIVQKSLELYVSIHQKQ